MFVRFMLVLAMSAGLVAAKPAAADDLHPQKAVTPEQAAAVKIGRYTLDLEEAGWTAYVFTEDGKVARGLVVGQRTGRFYALNTEYGDDFSELAIEGDRIAGKIKRIHALTQSVTIDAAVKDGAISGSFAGEVMNDKGDLVPVKGSVTGLFEDEQALKKRYAVAEGSDWPAWSGPFTNFRAANSNNKLVDTLHEARVVWRSEPTPPARSQDARYGFTDRREPTGGTASPIVADGMVFIIYFVPSGEAADQTSLDKIRRSAEARADKQGKKLTEEEIAAAVESVRDQWRIGTDDVVVAIDAATGKTLWRQVFQDSGVNWPMTKTRSWNRTPCAADGRLFVQGSLSQVYALDTRTGKLLWESLPPRYKGLKEGRDKAVAANKRGATNLLNARAVFGLIHADGVVICPDWNGGIVGLDAQSGKQLWHLPSTIGHYATPSRWTHQGKDYVIAGAGSGGAGKIHCIDPADGKTLWTIDTAAPNATTLGVDGDFLVAKSITEEVTWENTKVGPGSIMGCYRLSPTGAEKIWDLQGKQLYWDEETPALGNGHVYAQLEFDKLVCIELATGEIKSIEQIGVGGGDACMAIMDGHIIANDDGSHSDTAFHFYDAAPAALKRKSEKWAVPHMSTTAYHPALSFPCVDGRLIVRGGNAIYCYDLRKPAAE